MISSSLLKFSQNIFQHYSFRGCPRGVMVKAMDCRIVVSEFALLRSLSGKYPWERYELPYPPSYGLNSTTTVLLGEWLWHWITYKGWYAMKANHYSFRIPLLGCLSYTWIIFLLIIFFKNGYLTTFRTIWDFFHQSLSNYICLFCYYLSYYISYN